MIKFLCPNGHQLSAPENLAGKPGKCPKCNTAFVVPTPEEEEPQPEATPVEVPAAAAPAPAAAPPQPAIGMGSGKGKSSTKEVFVFLCPNGHKLNGPPSLKGKPGQCPHCGAKFRIPADDDLEAPAEISPEEASGTPSGAFVFPGMQEQQIEEVYDAVEYEDAPDPPPAEFHAMSYILGRLWDRKAEGTELEIYLSEGEIVGPDLFCESLSCREYGVFANVETDGSYAITVIPWSAVRKVAVRKMPELSPKWFS
jgi:hypothetical protein